MFVRFFHWWGTELAGLLPMRLRTWCSSSGPWVLMQLDEQRIIFERATAGKRERLFATELDREAPDMQGVAVMRQLSQHVGTHFRLLLSLPPSLSMRRTVSLPLATEENLGQTLSFELDRYTPFKPDQSYFDFRISNRDESRRLIEVELATAKRTVVDDLLRIAAAHGLNIQGLAFDGEVLGGGRPIESAAIDANGATNRVRWRIGLGMLAVLLLVVLLAIPIWQKRSAAIALLAPLAEAKLAAQETDKLRERLGKLAAEHNALSDKKWSSPSVLMILDELSKRLKDDTYVSNLSFEGNSVALQGESGSAAELVEALEISPLFHNVAFRSPLTKMQGGYDRFHIGLELSAEGLPKPPASAEPGKP